MAKGSFILGILVFFWLVFCGAPKLLAGIKEEPRHNLDAYARYIPGRPAKSDSGKIGVLDTQAEYSYDVELCGKLPVRIGVLTEYIGIDNTTALDLPAHLVGVGSDIETTLPFFNFQETYLRFGVNPGFYGGSWDFEPSEFRITSRFLLIKRPSRKLTWVAGIGVYPDFENEVLPILGFIYKPNEKWIFSIVPKRPNISYFCSKKLTLFIKAGSSINSEFEVNRVNSKNVVFSYKEKHLGAGASYAFSRHCEIFLSVGEMFDRLLQYRDGEGKVAIKNGIFTELRFQAKL